jgi:hypothetical protein
MTLEEFAANLRQDILARGTDSSNYEVDTFTEDVIEAMTDSGEADGFILCNCDRRGYKINAYNISSDGDCIDLFVTVYTKESPPQKVSAADIDRNLARLRGFFQRALTDSFRVGLEESSPEFDASDSIHSAKDEVTRGRLFLLTDGITTARDYEDVVIDGVRFSHHAWDIDRIYRMQTSGAAREVIDVNFEDFGGRVVCICSADPAYEYVTYVGFFPPPPSFLLAYMRGTARDFLNATCAHFFRPGARSIGGYATPSSMNPSGFWHITMAYHSKLR